eukprot:1603183-Pleurochrysis_carterae.AAC.1
MAASPVGETPSPSKVRATSLIAECHLQPITCPIDAPSDPCGASRATHALPKACSTGAAVSRTVGCSNIGRSWEMSFGRIAPSASSVGHSAAAVAASDTQHSARAISQSTSSAAPPLVTQLRALTLCSAQAASASPHAPTWLRAILHSAADSRPRRPMRPSTETIRASSAATAALRPTLDGGEASLSRAICLAAASATPRPVNSSV